jgi:hypothetical protein
MGDKYHGGVPTDHFQKKGHTFRDPTLVAIANVALACGAVMKTATKPANTNQAPPPGALFRWPGMSARPRIVEETGPCVVGATTALSGAASVGAQYGKFQTLDLDLGFMLELDFTTTFTAGSGKTLTAHPFGILQWVQQLSVQFESAYNTFRLPGILAVVMQSYRSLVASKNFETSAMDAGASVLPVSALVDGITTAAANWKTSLLSTPNFQLNVSTGGVQQQYKLFLEVPVSMYFDIYYELNASGQAIGPPATRAIVSPQRMAATTRNVTPKLTLAQGLSAQPTSATQSGPVSLAAGDALSTFTGSVNSTWFRDALIPSQNPITEPPNRMWQYSRDFIQLQTSGAGTVPIPLDDEVPGQGQILSLVFFTYDPALNAAVGGVTPFAAYSTLELLYGSTVQIFQETPQLNQYVWAMQHGSVLPTGFFGWDLMMTEDGRLSNEFAINTLVTAGAQIRITYNAGSAPGPAATVFVGLEMLKKVGS